MRGGLKGEPMKRQSALTALLLTSLCACLGAQSALGQEQSYKGATISLVGFERARELREPDSSFWFVPGNAEEELVIVRMKVKLSGGSVSFNRSDVALLDAQGKKYDWRGVTTVSEDFAFSGPKTTSRHPWDRMTVLVDPKDGTLYIDKGWGRMLVTGNRGETRFLFSVPRGAELKTLKLGKLQFDLGPAPKPQEGGQP